MAFMAFGDAFAVLAHHRGFRVRQEIGRRERIQPS